MNCYGQELNPETYAIAKANALISRRDNDKLYCGNTLSDDKLKDFKFDFVYLDPPFASKFVDEALTLMHEKNILAKDAIIVVERDLQNDLQNIPDCYIIKKSKKYGTIFVDVLSYDI